MGSASSHGIQLTPVRTTTYSTTKHYHGRRINRYAHPHNRVLPPPVAGQRLRSTDNGSILQEKGTIRGQRTGGSPLPSEVESEFLRVLQRRSERSLDGGKSTSIGNKWQSYSDPNITYSLQITDSSKKSKSSKKIRAPAPPSQKKKNGKKMKSPAPPPPIVAVVHSITPKNRVATKFTTAAQEGTNILFPDSRPIESRHTILEKRNHPPKNESIRNAITENRNHINEAFSEEIREATKRVAEKMVKATRRNSIKADRNRDVKSPKQYYFPDVEVKRKSKQGAIKVDEAIGNDKKLTDSAITNHGPKTKRDQIETNEQEKLHNRISYQQPPLREWESERNSIASSSCYSDTLPSLSGSDDDDDINLKLRPTLPRRQLELPRFSPTEAWKFLGIPNLGMNKESVPSSEGEDEERIWRINKLTLPKTAILERCEDSGISPDAESPVMIKDKYNIPNKQQQTIVIGQHSWIPQQDLLEDSDSNEFDDCIRNRRFVRVPVKLALPNDMFCSKLNFINKTVNHDDPEQRENRIKNRRNVIKNTKQGDGLNNIKKTLGMRTKSPYTEKLDSNWLLNQKNGKNYRLIGNYNYVNSGGRKQLQSLIFGVKKERQKEEQKDRSSFDESGLRRKFSFYSTEGHVIYLPEYETVDLMRKQTKRKEMERKHSSRRKKISDKRPIGMTEVKRLDNDEWLLQMQKQHKRERDKEKINIRDKLKMCQMDMHPTSRIHDEDFHTRSFENLSDRQEEISSPLVGSEWKSTPAELNSLHPLKVESSTSSPSSPESAQCNTRKPYTGASKWMRRQRQPPQKRNISPTRPEPEGGGASSDENHQANDDTPTDNSQSPITRNPSVYTQLMEMAKEEEQKLKSEEQLNAAQARDSTHLEIAETEPKQKFNFEKEGAESSWKFKSVYPTMEATIHKNVPNKPKETPHPCTKTFYMELEERMKQITQQSQNREIDGHDDDTKISRRQNGIVKTILPNVVVNEGGYKSVIQLSSVQPFTPNKGYRPVPFKLPALQKEDGENKSTEQTVRKAL